MATWHPYSAEILIGLPIIQWEEKPEVCHGVRHPESHVIINPLALGIYKLETNQTKTELN